MKYRIFLIIYTILIILNFINQKRVFIKINYLLKKRIDYKEFYINVNNVSSIETFDNKSFLI